MRADIQVAVDKLFSTSPLRFFGIFEQQRYETLTFVALTKDGQHAHTIAPVQCRDVDIGEAQPVKCLNNGLRLCRQGDLPYVARSVVSSRIQPGGRDLCRDRGAGGQDGEHIHPELPCRARGGRAGVAILSRQSALARGWRGLPQTIERRNRASPSGGDSPQRHPT